MLLITCPVTGIDELVADSHIRSVANFPTHIAMTVECPCGHTHVYRTGRRWEEAHPTHIAMHVHCPACGGLHVYRTGRRLEPELVPA